MAWPNDNLAGGGSAESVFAPSGNWVSVPSSGAGTQAVPLNGARIDWIDLPPCQIDRLGFEVTVLGAAGSLTRVCAWFDSGFGGPGLLAADGGQIATDGTTGVKSAVVAIVHPGGRLWVCAINQGAAAPATLRCVSTSPHQVVASGQPTTDTVPAWTATIPGVPPNNPVGFFANNPPNRVTVRIV
jgi:hypothetical protein